MGLLDAVFAGPPSGVVSGGSSNAPNVGMDTTNYVTYVSAGNGWYAQPGSMVQKAASLGNLANVANLLTYTVPSNMGGFYSVAYYAVDINTTTAATLPGVNVAFTELD